MQLKWSSHLPRLGFLLARVVSMHSKVSQLAPFSLPVLEHGLSNGRETQELIRDGCCPISLTFC